MLKFKKQGWEKMLKASHLLSAQQITYHDVSDEMSFIIVVIDTNEIDNNAKLLSPCILERGKLEFTCTASFDRHFEKNTTGNIILFKNDILCKSVKDILLDLTKEEEDIGDIYVSSETKLALYFREFDYSRVNLFLI